MSIIASIVVWRQYVASVLLRREITHANETMADQQAELALWPPATLDRPACAEFIRLPKSNWPAPPAFQPIPAS
ncbi:MAG: hypothetical protein IPH54_20725 [Rhodoferax sp.]|nr:hypothetical protein [Rhodoferax sp.]